MFKSLNPAAVGINNFSHFYLSPQLHPSVSPAVTCGSRIAGVCGPRYSEPLWSMDSHQPAGARMLMLPSTPTNVYPCGHFAITVIGKVEGSISSTEALHCS